MKKPYLYFDLFTSTNSYQTPQSLMIKYIILDEAKQINDVYIYTHGFPRIKPPINNKITLRVERKDCDQLNVLLQRWIDLGFLCHR